ncbi:MAG: hypothetical protein K2N70_07395 [Helicobacter sp.]|nr:hypothetical protein [Helicobacter sp.]
MKTKKREKHKSTRKEQHREKTEREKQRPRRGAMAFAKGTDSFATRTASLLE